MLIHDDDTKNFQKRKENQKERQDEPLESEQMWVYVREEEFREVEGIDRNYENLKNFSTSLPKKKYTLNCIEEIVLTSELSNREVFQSTFKTFELGHLKIPNTKLYAEPDWSTNGHSLDTKVFQMSTSPHESCNELKNYFDMFYGSVTPYRRRL